jgi:hypothetical protein
MKDYIFGGLSLLLVGLLFFAGKPDYEPMASNLLTKTWALDTITNAANDTLLMPWTMQNRYTGALQITRTNISGTTNLAITVQTNVASTSSTDETWNTVLTSAGTGATAELLTLEETYGQQYRIIVDGTGTQSSSYRLSWLGKKKPN